MAKNFTSRGISVGSPRVLRAVVIKALLNSRRGNRVCRNLNLGVRCRVPLIIPHPSRTRFGLRLFYREGPGLGLVFIFVRIRLHVCSTAKPLFLYAPDN